MAVFAAVAVEVAAFDCVRLPSFPSLQIRTGSAVLVAPTCCADEAAPLSWPVQLSWPSACTEGSLPPQPHAEPDWSCVPVCETGAVLVAVAVDVSLFDCVTLPPPPSLPIRTGSFELEAPT